MKNILFLILIVFGLSLGSCKYPVTIQKNRNGKLTLEREFATQGEYATFNAKKVFRKKHRDESYPAYNRKIETSISNDGISIIYDSTKIEIGIQDTMYVELYSRGIITPQMLGCYSLEGHGILITELNYLQKRHKRRFELWVWQPNEMNPQSFLLELTNTGKFKRNNLEDFLRQAKVTFVHNNGIII